MSKQSYRELKSLAKVQGIKGYHKMKKAELLKQLRIDELVDTTRKTMGQKHELTDQKLLNYYCIHGKYKYQCRACKGSGYCNHDKKLYLCKVCTVKGSGGKGICQHNRRKYICRDCNGKGVCKHGKQKYFCADCNGSGMCYYKRKDYCKICSNILNP